MEYSARDQPDPDAQEQVSKHEILHIGSEESTTPNAEQRADDEEVALVTIAFVNIGRQDGYAGAKETSQKQSFWRG